MVGLNRIYFGVHYPGGVLALPIIGTILLIILPLLGDN